MIYLFLAFVLYLCLSETLETIENSSRLYKKVFFIFLSFLGLLGIFYCLIQGGIETYNYILHIWSIK